MRIRIMLACLALLVAVSCGLFLPGFLDSGSVANADLAGELFINEVSGDNPDEDDWVELYNGGSGAIDLSGFFMSDSAANPAKWAIPRDTYVPEDGFLVIVCDGSGKDLHAGFKLNAGIDGIYLSTPREAIIVDGLDTVPASGQGSYGRTTDGGGTWAIFETPTPGKSNS
jgi:hypothetical protein